MMDAIRKRSRVFAANTASCDDGNSCTNGDVCSDGACLSGANTCACVTDGDCIAEEDGNLCNGTLACVNNQCVVAAGHRGGMQHHGRYGLRTNGVSGRNPVHASR